MQTHSISFFEMGSGQMVKVPQNQMMIFLDECHLDTGQTMEEGFVLSPAGAVLFYLLRRSQRHCIEVVME